MVRGSVSSSPDHLGSVIHEEAGQASAYSHSYSSDLLQQKDTTQNQEKAHW